MHVRVLLSRYRAYITCPSCNDGRYQPEALNYKLSAIRDPKSEILFTLPEFQALSISDARDCLRNAAIPAGDKTARMLRDEICARLNYLCEVGVGYLTLDRSTRTLSGGEVQRVNLTTCLGASLVNTLFVMDEPSVGLHPRDVGQLVRVMHNLRDKGNTLLVVEHEEQIIRAADNLIDLGPGRGEHGGELVWNGPLDDFLRSARILRAGEGILPSRTSEQSLSATGAAVNEVDAKSSPLQNAATSTLQACAPQSLTRDYLSGSKSIPIQKSRRKSTSSI
jgi:excinuclease ABC subunit A